MHSTAKHSELKQFSAFGFILLSLLATSSFGQTYKAVPRADNTPILPTIFYPDTVHARVMAEADRTKPNLYAAFADEIKGMPAYNVYAGDAYEELGGWHGFLEELASNLTAHIQDSKDYRIQIVRDHSINAYALAGGYLSFHVGLLAEANSVEEIALVLAHEIGHNMSRHAWDGYMDLHRAQTTALITSFAGGMAAMIGRAAAITTYLGHSREDERQADVLAIQMLKMAQYDLRSGAQMYKTFSTMERNEEIKTGKSNTGHWLYGSTHPGSQERFESIMLSNPEELRSKNSTVFYDLRTIARTERLNLLMAELEYRQVIECAWKYLMQEPDQMAYKVLMLDATRRYLMTYDVAGDEQVLTHDYNFPSGVEHDLEKGSTLDAGTLSYLSGLLITEVTEDSTPPFAWGITFNNLKAELIKTLTKSESDEIQLLLALSDDDPMNALESYVKNGGEQEAYVEWLKRDKEEQRPKKIVVMPDVMYIPGNGYSYHEKDYTHFMNFYDFAMIRQEYYKDGYEMSLVRKDEISSQSPYQWDMYNRLEHLTLDQNIEKAVDPGLLDPELAQFMMADTIDAFSSFSIYPAKNLVVCDVLVHEFNGQTTRLRSKSGVCLGIITSTDYLADQIGKRYKKLKVVRSSDGKKK